MNSRWFYGSCDVTTFQLDEILATKLRATEKKLLEKHAGKVVDFKVVIKDGKAIVRPILK